MIDRNAFKPNIYVHKGKGAVLNMIIDQEIMGSKLRKKLFSTLQGTHTCLLNIFLLF